MFQMREVDADKSAEAGISLADRPRRVKTEKELRPGQNALIRIAFWTIFVFLGAAQTWAARHDIFSDGISYIEIAKAYARGDWNMAVNPYWSPLYSWLLMLAYQILRPAPYWDVAVLHLVNFVEFLLCLGAAEYFLYEVLQFRRAMAPDANFLPDYAIRIAGYCTVLFAGLSMVNIWYCSPDMIAMALILTLSALILRLDLNGPSTGLSIGIGVVCALSFLARTAFAPVFVLCLAICAFLLYRARRPVWRTIGIVVTCMALLCGPFVVAISRQAGKATMGEAGALNYGWEVDGAARYAHWQGEPYDIGRPKHPTTEATTDPRSYTFAGPVPGTYPPWFNPAYWYDGIRPKLKLKPQLAILIVNLSVLANLSVRSAIVLCLVPLLLVAGWRSWLARLLRYWPILIPSLAVISMYCLVYIEKRYIAGNLVVLWVAALASFSVPARGIARFATYFTVVVCLLYTGVFVVRRQTMNVWEAATDLAHRQERFQNVQFRLAERLRAIGLRAGDKVAYIGPAVDADWARLDKVKIVGEIPLFYERNRRLLNNTLIDKTDDIKKFWTDPGPGRAAVLEAFRKAGARMVVTDGFYDRQFADAWKRVLPAQSKHFRDDGPLVPSQLNTRYLWLDPSAGQFAAGEGRPKVTARSREN